jgi:hypothetical protein
MANHFAVRYGYERYLCIAGIVQCIDELRLHIAAEGSPVDFVYRLASARSLRSCGDGICRRRGHFPILASLRTANSRKPNRR